ncbi:MAG: DHA2 family efflux MFS transporter permease subunit [Rhodoblastus sp.]
MSEAGAARVSAPAAPAAGGGSPWLIASVVALASFMEVLDTTISNVALPYIAGGMGVSQDESTWVVTTYLVSNSVILTASPFLARMMGRKRFFLSCLSLFTFSSLLCGFAWNLHSLLLFRIMQGLGGGGMVPVAQSILADSFPPEKRGQAFALFGMSVVVAPIVGPTLGGWLSDNWSWHWCFLINGPVGVIAMALIYVLFNEPPRVAALRRRKQRESGGFDLVGFLLIATFLGALEVVLDRGLEDDWFSSRFIVVTSLICVGAFILAIPWELTRRNPMIDLRLIGTRQFGACFFVMLAVGMILLGTTQIVPQLVQEQFGYTALWAGLVLSPGGVFTMVMMVVVGRLISFVQPKYLIVCGAAFIALSMHQLTRMFQGVDFWFFSDTRMILGVGLPMVFISITTASYYGIPADKTDQASAIINAARNIGGSIGVALSANVLAHRSQFHQNMLVGNISPASPEYQTTLQKVTHYFILQGMSAVDAGQAAIGWIGKTIASQTALLAYIDVFQTMMVIALAVIPLALSLRKIKLGKAAAGDAH